MPEKFVVFDRALSTLLDKKHRVRVFWNPRVPAENAEADRQNPTLTARVVALIGEVISRRNVDYTVPRFDPVAFGCSVADYIDLMHLDGDCLRRFFHVAFGSGQWPDKSYSLNRFARSHVIYEASRDLRRSSSGRHGR